jgi:hypothetical protein
VPFKDKYQPPPTQISPINNYLCYISSNQQTVQNKEKNIYSFIHLPPNLQQETTSSHTPLTFQYKPINCTNDISFIHKPSITQCLFLVIPGVCITRRWSPCTKTCCKKSLMCYKPLVVIEIFSIC